MLRTPDNRTSDKPTFSASEARGDKPLLVVRNIGIDFGGIAALKDVSFDVPRGDIVGLIGPNGAGKTTLFNCLSRIYRPNRGDILIENRSILQQPQHRMAAMGIGRTFQNVALFSTLSVRDNIRIGGHSVTTGDAISDMMRLSRRSRTEKRQRQKKPLLERGLEEKTYVLNLGPQHPSTHGVLRVELEMEGEFIVKADPDIGYGHRGHEHMAENRNFQQFLPNLGRVDYLHALAYNQCYCMAVEKLIGLQVPERAEFIRVITSELNRLTSHLLWVGAYLMDLGAFTPFL